MYYLNFLTAHLRKSYVIGLVNGQEKLTITESIVYTTQIHCCGSGGTVQTAAWQRRCARGSLALVQWRLFRSKWTAFGSLQGRRKV